LSLKASNPAIGSGDALAAERILEHLPAPLRHELRELTVLQQTDSTNSALARIPTERRHAHALLAEEQTGGRGRRQRSWHSPAGGNIYLSLGWRFDSQSVPLSTLPLVTALCLCRALDRVGLQNHGIKWPNDVLIDGAKLAGILVESQAVGSGPLLAVIGIGLNVRMPGGEGEQPGVIIDRPWTDMASHLPSDLRSVSRNEVAALLLEQLLPSLRRFETERFAAYQDEWRQRDLLTGRRLRLEGNGGFRYGQALGIEDDGGLKVDIDGYGPQVLYAADVSIQYD
jgi:BirA family biotin operon repressor/biotin-[acetyl-CoA-carboxylase] ligase